jgi:hypothetical protein
MRYALLFLMLAGCSQEPTAWQQAMRITGEEVTAKQDESLTILRENTAALQAIKSLSDKQMELDTEIVSLLKASLSTADLNRKDGDPAAREPQETERKSQTTPLLSDSPPAVRLFVTHSMPINSEGQQLEAAIKAGEFQGFEITYAPRFDGQGRYPGIRFQTKSSPTGWRVAYGFNSSTLPLIRHELSNTNAVVSQPRITNPVVSQTDLVSMHNQLHGGGQWTWPGDLATHLQTVHGVNLNGIPANHGTSQFASQRSAVRLVSRGSPRGWRSSYQARSSCPAGGCPR